ncbi:MAG: 4Fe-4S binding protein [Chlorobiales bacterium]|jgi:Pyruvate/2-oxoacid:ferredoxin oxidoreductase delta subunit|nr:4Fe-4S binding protein [Chlorobiales bacterium]
MNTDTNENTVVAAPVKKETRTRKKAVAAIIAETCTGCKICVAVCPSESIKIVESDLNFNGIAEIDSSCDGCNICAIDCPWNAIVMQYSDGSRKTAAEYDRQLKKMRGYQ